MAAVYRAASIEKENGLRDSSSKRSPATSKALLPPSLTMRSTYLRLVHWYPNTSPPSSNLRGITTMKNSGSTPLASTEPSPSAPTTTRLFLDLETTSQLSDLLGNSEASTLTDSLSKLFVIAPRMLLNLSEQIQQKIRAIPRFNV